MHVASLKIKLGLSTLLRISMLCFKALNSILKIQNVWFSDSQKSIGQSFCFMDFSVVGNNFSMDNLEEFFRSDLGMSTGRWPPEGSAKIFSELLRRDTNGTNGEGLELLRRAHSLDEKDTEMLSWDLRRDSFLIRNCVLCVPWIDRVRKSHYEDRISYDFFTVQSVVEKDFLVIQGSESYWRLGCNIGCSYGMNSMMVQQRRKHCFWSFFARTKRRFQQMLGLPDFRL